ncbi:LPXTG cell wall anchor domain-containing protein [Rathayibacter sp. AY1A1]|uniref:DUF7933 domain-containing protein n=1 Tax=Rathayibacter sp. AY1A1 TaxID=2080519 RepID=UPI0011AFFB9B|nr:LPXTG cell wall anchor domain-containing protein [Rathayibacter sp. AY1A1]
MAFTTRRRRHSRHRAPSRLGMRAVVFATIGALLVGSWGLGDVSASSPAQAANQADPVAGDAPALLPTPVAPTPPTAPEADPAPAPSAPTPSASAPSTSAPPAPAEAAESPSATAEEPAQDEPDPAAPRSAAQTEQPVEPTPAGSAPAPTAASDDDQESDRGPPATARAAGGFSTLAAGVAEAPRQVWTETFEQGLTATPSALTAYANGRYTAATGWSTATNCTGVLVNYTAPYPNPAFCPTRPLLTVGTGSSAARETRRMADVLGQVAAGVPGSTSSTAPANGSNTGTQANHALVEYPYAAVTGGTTVAQSAAGIGVSAPAARYYAVGMNAAGGQCGTINASLSLNLVSGGSTVLTGFAAPVVPCAATGSVFYTSPTLPLVGGLGALVDPALPASARAAAYTGTSTALLTPAQIAAAQVQLVNTVTGTGSAFAVDDLRVLDVTPALDAAFTQAVPTATVPTTLTYTVTNTSDLLAKADWRFSTALPAGLVVAPTPAVGGSCTDVTGTAFAVTAAAGSSSVSTVGGDLAAGATSCTISVDVVAAAAGTYSTGTTTPTGLIASAPTSVTIQAATTLTVRKNLPVRSATGDQFTLSVRSGTTVLASATTTGTATGIQAAQISRLTVQSGATYTIAEAQTAGAGLGYSNSYECSRGGTVIASGASAAGSITIPSEAGAEVLCTFTNTVQTPRLFCDTGRFYSLTAAGALQQADIVTGSLTSIGSWSGTAEANALGVGANGAFAYALDRSSDATDVDAVLKWTPEAGFQRIANSAYTTVAGGAQVTGSIVAGAVDLRTGRYLFGSFASGQFYIWSFTEANPVATRFALVGSFPTSGTPNGNGDMAFDARGNLYVVGAGSVNNASSAAIFTVPADALAAATGGTLPVNTSIAKAVTGTDAAFANINGIAFSPRGTVYLANGDVAAANGAPAIPGSAYEFDATTWTRVSGTPRVSVNAVDLSGCSSPATITVQKSVVGRLAAADQFQLTAAAGSPASPFATATTTGATTGRQTAQIGPFPTPINSTVTVSEAMAAGSASPITAYTSIYECYADGVRVSTGSNPTGTVTLPNRLGVNVTCTFFNSPRPASTVRITKTIRDASGTTRPGVDWTVGTTATATAGTVALLPEQSPRQQTDAAGQAAWTVLFGTEASRATLTVSEVQQTGFAFVSGACTVNGTARATTFSQSGTVISASLTGIASAAVVECSIVNRPTASLTLVKTVSSGSALPSDFTLSATGPTGALPGPTGRAGSAGVSAIPVTPGVAYRLAETGGAATYVQTAPWQCRTDTGAALTVSAAGDVTPTNGAAVTCTVDNASATITLVKQVLRPQTGFQAADWRVTATPAALAGATLPTETRAGAEYVAAGNPASTFEVRPGHGYTLSEAATDPTRRLAYQELRLERLTGTTWSPVASRTITAPTAGQTAVYRFVNAPVDPTRLPLTGGASTDAFLLGGGSVLTLALGLLLWERRRRLRGPSR